MGNYKEKEKRIPYTARYIPFRRLPPDGFWQVILALYFIPPVVERFFLAPNLFMSERMALYAFWVLPLMTLCYYLGLRGGLTAAAGVLPFFLWRLRLVLHTGTAFNSVFTVYFGVLIIFALLTGFLAERIIRFAESLIQGNVTDELTGLYNPSFFQQCLDREVERARRYHTPLSLVLLGFTEHGGIDVLTAARLLNKTVRGCDTVARYDSGEFAVILPQTTGANAKWFCERARQALEDVGTLVFGVAEYEAGKSGQSMTGDARQRLCIAQRERKKLENRQ
jgi:GGDEF domain-containing protein